LDIVSVDLSEMVLALTQAASVDFANKAIALEVTVEPGVVCDCDRVRVEQILWNLLANAVKFTPKGGQAQVEIAIHDGRAVISVADTGKGIAAEFLPSIFDMFNQADGKKTASSGGLGIGLALVRELTRAHGGDVQALSAGIDQGTKVVVSIPISRSVTQTATSASDEAASFKGLHILTVDDDADSLMAFAMLLRLEGAVVVTAASSLIALDLLSRSRYDLLISDVSMPEMDGYTLMARIRSEGAIPRVRAIAMSGYGREVDVLKAKMAGFDAHVPKPASIADLKRAVAEIMTDQRAAAVIGDASVSPV
jgi:two-component system CheB/CheR fusion protein